MKQAKLQCKQLAILAVKKRKEIVKERAAVRKKKKKAFVEIRKRFIAKERDASRAKKLKNGRPKGRKKRLPDSSKPAINRPDRKVKVRKLALTMKAAEARNCLASCSRLAMVKVDFH